MCFFSRSGYRLSIKPVLVRRKSTFRYNSMFNFIPVSFFLNFSVRLGLGLGSVIRLGLGLGLAFGFGIGNLKHI